MNKEHSLWVEKYRPTTLDNYVGNENIKKSISTYLNQNDIQNLIFYGPAGTGKTTLAKIIVKSLDCDYLYINASDERGIETIRDKVSGFASTMSFSPLKVIILDEADFLTIQAQASLRNVIETFSRTTRFIMTCNYIERVIDPLQSRCQVLKVIPPSKQDIAYHVIDILKKENLGMGGDDLRLVINQHYPDIRKILNTVQGSIKGGKLVLDSKSLINTDFENKVVAALKNKAKLNDIRQIIADSGAQQFESLFRCLYDNVEEYTTNIGEAIVIISQYQYEYSFVVDKEICVAAMLNKLLKL